MEKLTVGELLSKCLSCWNILSGNIIDAVASNLGYVVTNSCFITSTGIGSSLGSDGVVVVVDYEVVYGGTSCRNLL